MDTPQEVEVWYILPTLRKEFVVSFKKKKLKQNQIAKIMNLTQAAVSQYTKNKRGQKIKFSQEMIKILDNVVKDILNNKISYRLGFQMILRKIRDSKINCTICRDHIDTVESCDICYN